MSGQPYIPSKDLEDRTFQFAREIQVLIKSLPYSLTNSQDSKQLIRSSGSVGANYIESNEAVSKKDFIFRMRLSRKEAKETVFWLRLLMASNNMMNDKYAHFLLQEAVAIKKILSSIIIKSTN